MTSAEAELRAALTHAYTLPVGPGRFAALDSVFRTADAAGAVALEARIDALDDFHRAGDRAREFLAFSWCVTVFDSQPELFDNYYTHRLLWFFKWVISAFHQLPEIPLERTQALLSDMQRRYLHGGHSLHAVHQYRWLVAHHVGDTDNAQRWYEQMLAAARDPLSDCRSCVPADQVRYLASAGRHEAAIAVGAPFAAAGGCRNQPQLILTELLVPYLHTGRLSDAAHAHRVAYRRLRTARGELGSIAQHLHFCGLSGNESRGLELVDRHLSWLEQPYSPYAAMEFASAAAQVLNQACVKGKGDILVRRRQAAREGDRVRARASTVAEVRDEMTALARDLAGRFDRRNGNDHQSSRIERRIQAVPVVDSLSLSVFTPLAPDRPPADSVAAMSANVARLTAAGGTSKAAQAQLEAARALHAAERWKEAMDAAEEAVEALGEVGLAADVVRCRYLQWLLYSGPGGVGHRHEASAVLAELLELESRPDDVPPPAALLEEAADRLRNPEGLPRLLAAADIHNEQGRPSDELRVLRKALVSLGWRADVDARRSLLARADAVVAGGVGGGLEEARLEVARLDVAAGDALAEIGRVEEGLDRLGRAVSFLATTDLVDEWSEALLARADLALRSGHFVAAEEHARTLMERQTSPYDLWGSVLVAKALIAQERHDDAAVFMSTQQLDQADLDRYDDGLL